MSRSDRDKLNRIRELMDPDAMGLKGMTPLDPHDPASVERWAAAIAVRTARIREVLGVPDKRSIGGLRPRHVIMDEAQRMLNDRLIIPDRGTWLARKDGKTIYTAAPPRGPQIEPGEKLMVESNGSVTDWYVAAVHTVAATGVTEILVEPNEQFKSRIQRGPLPEGTKIHQVFRPSAGDEPILPVSEKDGARED